MMVIKPRLKKSGRSLKATWRTDDGVDLTVKEIADELAMGTCLDVDLSYTGIHAINYDPYKILLALIERLDFYNSDVNTAFVRRILLNGGLVAYAKKLEGLKKDE